MIDKNLGTVDCAGAVPNKSARLDEREVERKNDTKMIQKKEADGTMFIIRCTIFTVPSRLASDLQIGSYIVSGIQASACFRI